MELESLSSLWCRDSQQVPNLWGEEVRAAACVGMMEFPAEKKLLVVQSRGGMEQQPQPRKGEAPPSIQSLPSDTGYETVTVAISASFMPVPQ